MIHHSGWKPVECEDHCGLGYRTAQFSKPFLTISLNVVARSVDFSERKPMKGDNGICQVPLSSREPVKNCKFTEPFRLSTTQAGGPHPKVPVPQWVVLPIARQPRCCQSNQQHRSTTRSLLRAKRPPSSADSIRMQESGGGSPAVVKSASEPRRGSATSNRPRQYGHAQKSGHGAGTVPRRVRLKRRIQWSDGSRVCVDMSVSRTGGSRSVDLVNSTRWFGSRAATVRRERSP